jgi:glutamine synthetase
MTNFNFGILQKHQIKFIDLWFSDILGSVKNITIPVRQLKTALANGVWFDGSSVKGFGQIAESDMYLKLDPQTFAIIPWGEEKTGRFICDVYGPTHQPSGVDSRGVLKKMLARIAKKGWTYKVGAELEFHLLPRDGDKILAQPFDRVGYFDLSNDTALAIRKKMCERLEDFGILIEAFHHEVGQSQHEIDLQYSEALTQADNVFTARMVIKRVAEEHNLYATFMPKPMFGKAGNGMHIHQSIFKGNTNIFSNAQDEFGLSPLAYNYLAGLLAHVKDMSAITSPLVNSYKRLVSGFEAPVYICWGHMNRSVLVRVPRITKNKLESTRFELRSCDPSTNPYLLIALTLSAGLDGIENKLKPPKPIEDDVYHFDLSDLKKREIETLPRSLAEALQYYQKSKIVKKTLGDTLFERYYSTKLDEWNQYSIQVTKWEIDNYLELY